MDVKLSASISLDALPIECPDLHRRMAEVLALREMVASLEHGGKKNSTSEEGKRTLCC